MTPFKGIHKGFMKHFQVLHKGFEMPVKTFKELHKAF